MKKSLSISFCGVKVVKCIMCIVNTLENLSNKYEIGIVYLSHEIAGY